MMTKSMVEEGGVQADERRKRVTSAENSLEWQFRRGPPKIEDLSFRRDVGVVLLRGVFYAAVAKYK